jgi:hypothetical protein
MTAGLQGYSGAWGQICQPIRLMRILDVIELGDQMVAGAAPLKVQLATMLQIRRASVKSKGQIANATDDEVVLLRPCEPERNLCLAHRKAKFARVRDQLDHNVRVLRMQGCEAGRKNVTGDGLRAGDANEAGETRVATANTSFQGQRLSFKTLRLGANLLTGQGWLIPGWRSVE